MKYWIYTWYTYFWTHTHVCVCVCVWTLDVEIHGKIKRRMFSKQGKIIENIMMTLTVLWLNILNAKELEIKIRIIIKNKSPPKNSVWNTFSFLGNLAICSKLEKGIFKSSFVTAKMRCFIKKKIGENPDRVSLIYCLTAFFPVCKYSGVSSSKVPWNTTTVSTIWSQSQSFTMFISSNLISTLTARHPVSMLLALNLMQ